MSSIRVFALCLAVLASSSRAAEAPPKHRLVLNNLTLIRYNPLGLESQFRFGYQVRLYEHSSMLGRDNFAFVGISPKFNPAYVKLAPSIELQPMSMLNLRFTAEYLRFFSTFGYLQSFTTPHANYSDSALASRRDAGLNYATSGFHVFGEALLQAKVGPIAVRNRFALERWRMTVNPGDRVWYDATLDTLVPADGWMISNDLDALYLMPNRGLTVGLRYSLVQPLYGPNDFDTLDFTVTRNGHHRLGPLVAYTFFDNGYTSFNKPTVLLIANWYLAHSWRTGLDVSRALPYVVLAFAFQSDLLGK
jgi:hypothetical protein